MANPNPTPVNGVAAANKLLRYGSVKPGYCLYYVWKAYDSVGANTNRTAGTAYEAWLKSEGKHKGDKNPPAGVPVFFGKKASSAAGDVVISLGGGKIAVTEAPGKGAVTGVTTIAARQKQIGRPYLGWTESIFDQKIAYEKPKPSTSGSKGKVSKLPWANGRTDEEIVEAEQRWLNKVINAKLKVDGELGTHTNAAIKKYQHILGISADGVWGKNTQAAHQKLFNQIKKNTIVRKGGRGPIVKVIQLKVGAKQDGIFGNDTQSKVAAHQSKKKLKRDGIVGKNTWDSFGF